MMGEVVVLTADTADRRPCCGEQMRERIDALFQVLPAKSWPEVADEMGLPLHVVAGMVSHLRKNEEEHRWTIPHCRRGKTMDDDRIHAALVSPNGRRTMDDGTLNALQQGLIGTLSETGTKGRNEAVALRAAAQAAPPEFKRGMLDAADDLNYFVRKIRRLETDMRSAMGM